jgi:DDE family transposase
MAGSAGSHARPKHHGLRCAAVQPSLTDLPIPGAHPPARWAKRLGERDPGLLPALDWLVGPDTRGDPESPAPCAGPANPRGSLLMRSPRRGTRSATTPVGRLLREQGYRLQRTVKTLEGAQHPDRDAQFRYLNEHAKQLWPPGGRSSRWIPRRSWSGTSPTAAGSGSPPASPNRSMSLTSRPHPRQGHPVWGRRPGSQQRLGRCRDRPRHRGVRGPDAPTLVAAGQPSRLPAGRAAAGLCGCRWVQRLPGAGVEDRAGPAGG